MADKIYKHKNIKIDASLHAQIKEVAKATGINIGKLLELGVIHVIKEYHSGAFDNLVSARNIRRDGSLTRSGL